MLNIEGEVIWRYDTSKKGGYSAWSVRNDGKNAYFTTSEQLIAVDLQTGKKIWEQKASASFGVLLGILFNRSLI